MVQFLTCSLFSHYCNFFQYCCRNLPFTQMLCKLQRPQSTRTDPLLLIYSFQFRSAFCEMTAPSQPLRCACRARTMPSQPRARLPSQPEIRRPYKAPTSVTHRQPCEINSSIDVLCALTLLVGRQEDHLACKNCGMMCWCGSLSKVRCK